MKPLSQFHLIIVEKADNTVAQGGIVTDFPEDLFAAVPCAHNKEFLAPAVSADSKGKRPQGSNPARAVLQPEPEEKPNPDPVPCNKKQGEEPDKDEGCPGKTFKSLGKDHEGYEQQGPHAAGLDDVDDVIDARVTPHALVQIKEMESDDFDKKDDGENMGHHRRCIGRDVEIEAQEVGRIPGEGHKKNINGHDNQEIPVDLLGHLSGWSDALGVRSLTAIPPRPVLAQVHTPGCSTSQEETLQAIKRILGKGGLRQRYFSAFTIIRSLFSSQVFWPIPLTFMISSGFLKFPFSSLCCTMRCA